MGISIRWDAAPGVQAIGQYAAGQQQGRVRAADQYLQHQQLRLQQDAQQLRERQVEHQQQHWDRQHEMDRELHEMRRQQWEQDRQAQIQQGLASGRLYYPNKLLDERKRIIDDIVEVQTNPRYSPEARRDTIRRAREQLAEIEPIERPIDERPRSLESQLREQIHNFDAYAHLPWRLDEHGRPELPRGVQAPKSLAEQAMDIYQQLMQQTKEVIGENNVSHMQPAYTSEEAMKEAVEGVKRLQEVQQEIEAAFGQGRGQQPGPQRQQGHPEPRQEAGQPPPRRSPQLEGPPPVGSSRPAAPEAPKAAPPTDAIAQAQRAADQVRDFWSGRADEVWEDEGLRQGREGIEIVRRTLADAGSGSQAGYWEPPSEQVQEGMVRLPAKGQQRIHPIHQPAFAALQEAGFRQVEVAQDKAGNLVPVARNEQRAEAYLEALPSSQFVLVVLPDGRHRVVRGKGTELRHTRAGTQR